MVGIDASFSDVISSLIHKPNRACLNLAGLYFILKACRFLTGLSGYFRKNGLQ